MFYLFLVFLIFTTACSPAAKNDSRDFSDDYVLVEFASKLEEDYHRMKPSTHEKKKP